MNYDRFLNPRIAAVPPSGIRRFFDLAATMKDTISLGVGEPDFKTPYHIRNAAIDSLVDGETQYTGNRGLPELREEIALYLQGRYGISYNPEKQILVTIGASLEEVASTIEELEKRRVILRYAPMINWDLTDRERVEAMIEVRVTPQRDMGFDAIARRIYCFDEVKTVFLMSGSYDLLVLVEARTLKELAAFVSAKLSTLETVTGTATSFVLKRYKEEGVIFDSEDADHRLVISP